MRKYPLIILIIGIILTGCSNEAISGSPPKTGVVFDVTGQYDVYIAGEGFGITSYP